MYQKILELSRFGYEVKVNKLLGLFYFTIKRHDIEITQARPDDHHLSEKAMIEVLDWMVEEWDKERDKKK